MNRVGQWVLAPFEKHVHAGGANNVLLPFLFGQIFTKKLNYQHGSMGAPKTFPSPHTFRSTPTTPNLLWTWWLKPSHLRWVTGTSPHINGVSPVFRSIRPYPLGHPCPCFVFNNLSINHFSKYHKCQLQMSEFLATKWNNVSMSFE